MIGDFGREPANFRPAAPSGYDRSRLRLSPVQADNCFSAIENHSARLMVLCLATASRISLGRKILGPKAQDWRLGQAACPVFNDFS
jgi:hypothetical protein